MLPSSTQREKKEANTVCGNHSWWAIIVPSRGADRYELVSEAWRGSVDVTASLHNLGKNRLKKMYD